MSYSKNFMLEELGKGMNGTVEVSVDYDWDSGEPQTWDHPGSPGGCEMTSWTVMSYTNGEIDVLCREDRPDWFAWLDGVIERLMLDNEDLYNEQICEDHGPDGWYPEHDDLWDEI